MKHVDHNDCTVNNAKMCFYVRLCSKFTGDVFSMSVNKFGATPSCKKTSPKNPLT